MRCHDLKEENTYRLSTTTRCPIGRAPIILQNDQTPPTLCFSLMLMLARRLCLCCGKPINQQRDDTRVASVLLLLGRKIIIIIIHLV